MHRVCHVEGGGTKEKSGDVRRHVRGCAPGKPGEVGEREEE